MRFAGIVIVCLVMVESAQAMLRAGPDISYVGIDKRDPNNIYIRIEYSTCKAAYSSNGGMTFRPLDEQTIPVDLLTNLSLGLRRYVLSDNRLLRSDDGGVTWTNTAARSFLWNQAKAELKQEEKHFWDKYGARLPDRSDLWHPIFGLFAVCYFLLSIRALRAQGWLSAIWTGLRGVFIILLVWCLLVGFHAYFRRMIEWIAPSPMVRPSPKLGWAMAIAARPLPLLVYLLVLWPLLPGSLNVMSGNNSSQKQSRRRMALSLSVVVGAVFIAFHLYIMFIGYFWE